MCKKLVVGLVPVCLIVSFLTHCVNKIVSVKNVKVSRRAVTPEKPREGISPIRGPDRRQLCVKLF